MDQQRQVIKHDIAFQLYKGKNSDNYQSEWPENFEAFAEGCKSHDNEMIAQTISKFLYFIGTGISAENLLKHLESKKSNRNTLVKKAGRIFKTMSHLPEDRSIYYLFEECDDEWFYLLNIEHNMLSGVAPPL